MPPHPRLASSVLPPLSPPGDTWVWSLGDPALDGLLPGGGLDPAALHEVKPRTHRDWPAALGFALGLAARRVEAQTKARSRLSEASDPAAILFCWPVALAAELGRLYAPGLASLGLAARSLIVVEPRRSADALWVLEEALKSQALALVVGGLPEIGLTPARRLSLAAAAGATPCLLLTAPQRASAPAAATRWRIAGAPSAPHPLAACSFASGPFSSGTSGTKPAVSQALGARRLALRLERCRGGPPALETQSLVMEWCDAAHRFRLAAGLADRAPRAAGAGAGSGPPAVRAG